MITGILIGMALLITMSIVVWVAMTPDDEVQHINDLIQHIEEEHGTTTRLTVYRSDVDQS